MSRFSLIGIPLMKEENVLAFLARYEENFWLETVSFKLLLLL